MKISTDAIVSNSDMIKNYKKSREKAEELGKIFILKNNQPDAVLLSICEYERLSSIIEYLESLGEEDLATVVNSLPAQKKNTFSVDRLISVMNENG